MGASSLSDHKNLEKNRKLLNTSQSESSPSLSSTSSESSCTARQNVSAREWTREFVQCQNYDKMLWKNRIGRPCWFQDMTNMNIKLVDQIKGKYLSLLGHVLLNPICLLCFYISLRLFWFLNVVDQGQLLWAVNCRWLLFGRFPIRSCNSQHLCLTP